MYQCLIYIKNKYLFNKYSSIPLAKTQSDVFDIAFYRHDPLCKIGLSLAQYVINLENKKNYLYGELNIMTL